MRITCPPAEPRIRLEEINLADTGLYVAGDAHAAWRTLRAECPLFWQEQPHGEGFWAVTRRADVCMVLAEYESFTSESGTAIAMLDGPDPAAGMMMHATDPPRHRDYRRPLGKSFTPHALSGQSGKIRSFVGKAMEPIDDDAAWDVAASFAQLPVAVAALLLGLPDTDTGLLKLLAYASLAPLDPRFGDGHESTADLAHHDLIDYFTGWVARRRKEISDDLISQLIVMEVEGQRLTDHEIILNCLSLLLGAVVTTSQVISATFVTLAEQHNGEGRWPDDVDVPTAVEEALRWSSPVTHFMRRARRDMFLYDQRIRAGDAVTAWIASANRDENVFEQPYTFDFGRRDNPHVAFGYGPHRCLGMHLARLMLRESFAELIAGIESFELAGPPSHLVSNEIAGIVSLPLRVKRAAGR
jgi:cytochrome P450